MNDDPAMARFLVIQLARLSGVALAVFGLLVLAGRVDLPRMAGLALTLLGMADALVAPLLLARRWKSPPP
jgi:hypothetical protein